MNKTLLPAVVALKNVNRMKFTEALLLLNIICKQNGLKINDYLEFNIAKLILINSITNN